MNDRIIVLLGQVQAKHPELRVGQIMSNAATYGGWDGNDIFYCPDYRIEAGLKKILNI